MSFFLMCRMYICIKSGFYEYSYLSLLCYAYLAYVWLLAWLQAFCFRSMHWCCRWYVTIILTRMYKRDSDVFVCLLISPFHLCRKRSCRYYTCMVSSFGNTVESPRLFLLTDSSSFLSLLHSVVMSLVVPPSLSVSSPPLSQTWLEHSWSTTPLLMTLLMSLVATAWVDLLVWSWPVSLLPLKSTLLVSMGKKGMVRATFWPCSPHPSYHNHRGWWSLLWQPFTSRKTHCCPRYDHSLLFHHVLDL